MSYEEFRRRIDTMRNILVGAVPSPAGQIDQITYALMYKFMNDLDDKSASMGGKRSYFTGDYAKYNWHQLMAPQIGAHERLELYRQAIQTMSKNENIPELFRSIYQNAFLPYNSAPVLTHFLKEVNDGFTHGEGDDIGDAYEYLLSITGAQGDVGQFRTPRHIIKFIVEAVNPTKDDRVLDPACGTAGFLISAYSHVISQHDGKDKQGKPNNEKRLTADERDMIHHNYRGFDIDPTMVRTSKVNMYLHDFKTPNIINHDSLTSEDYWSDKYDVILANPPFMTPKGGIQPHKKFSVSANRAEVLFVDYIQSHLKPTGRAGIIVPEGIIFQSGKAYKQLRKNLIENSLYAVVSLPSGVFNPYAGVKTSILLLDKQLAKERDEVLFVKIENDGYSLGAQRRPIAGNQFPEALEAIEQFRSGAEPTSQLAHAVKKSEITESGDYNLSGDRYKPSMVEAKHEYPIGKLQDVFIEIKNGKNVTQTDEIGKYRVSRIQTIATGRVNLDATKWTTDDVKDSDFLRNGDILFSHINSYDHLAKTALFDSAEAVVHGANLLRLRPDTTKATPEFLSYILKSDIFINEARRFAQKAVNQASINSTSVKNLQIPLPPLEIQRQIVDELDGYQRIIDAATAIVKTYKPTIKINPDWETVKLGDYVSINNGQVLTDFDENGLIACIKVGDMNLDENARYINTSTHWTNKDLKGMVETGSVIFPKRGAAIATNKKRLNKIPCYIDNNCMAITVSNSAKLDCYFLYYFMLGFDLSSISNSAGVALINNPDIKGVNIPLPSLNEQKQIVADLEAEQKLIDANKKLITLYQQKIRTKIAEVWGE